MNKNHFMLVLLIVLVSACTTYQPYEPTGEVVNEINLIEEVSEEETAVEEITEGETMVEEPVEELEDILQEILGEVEEPEVIQEPPTEVDITATEGDLIDLMPFVMDPDGDAITVSFTEPFDEEGMWQTGVGDEGFYSLIVSATDHKDSFVPLQMTVTVLPANKPPVINIGDSIEFNEGDLINIDADIYDEDDEEIVVMYSGWMTSRSYKSNYDDAGEYEVTIRADDGMEIVSKTVKVVVNDVNRKPTLTLLNEPSIEVTEGETVELIAEAKDPDGDTLEIMYSEPLDDKGQWKTQKGDAGTYELFVTASDGVNEVKNNVLLEVMKRNEPPVIESVTITPEKVVLKKPGDEVTIKLKVVANDADGDDFTVKFSGFMDSDEKTVKYGEKGGLKTVKVIVNDGKDSVTKEVSFEMNNWPCFECK